MFVPREPRETTLCGVFEALLALAGQNVPKIGLITARIISEMVPSPTSQEQAARLCGPGLILQVR